MKPVTTWFIACIAALAIAAIPVLLGEGPDPEALQATSDSVDDARRDVQFALAVERIDARGARR